MQPVFVKKRGLCRQHYRVWWLGANPGYGRDYAKGYYRRKLAKPRRDCVCGVCGMAFSTARDDQRFCSGRCNRKFWSRKAYADKKAAGTAWNDRRKANAKARRARKKNTVVVEVVRPDEIRARDGNRCGLCGGKVSDKPYPHPLSASLDHIVPLARGGSHEPANVHLTHLRCNLKKGARGGGEQLRMI